MKKPREKAVVREFFIDDAGHNKIIMHNFGKRIVLFIQLKAEGKRKRKIGVITKSTRTLQITRKRGEHLFRKLSAYGFNEYVLREGKRFDTIWLKDEFDEWKIPKSHILEKGKYVDENGDEVTKEINYYWFQKQGFELQIFTPLDEIEPFRVKPKENRRF